MRLEDSPDLFGCGVGGSTTAPVDCEWCGGQYEDPNDIQSVGFTDFAGKQICDCCFEKIEAEILRRMPDILKWYRRFINRNKKTIDRLDGDLKAIEEA